MEDVHVWRRFVFSMETRHAFFMEGSSRVRRALPLLLGWVFLACLYGVFAFQGVKPFLSPDETAVFAVATRLMKTGTLSLDASPTIGFPWVHPRSFIPQYGSLIPVGFPLWSTILGVVGWIGSGFMSILLAVVFVSSMIVPLVWMGERFMGWSRGTTVLWALTGLCVPVAILYGNRSFFTLMPQMAGLTWVMWGMMRNPSSPWIQGALGMSSAFVIGLRPTEIVWIGPIMLASFLMERRCVKNIPILLGVLLGFASLFLLHTWAYGSPFMVGYWLRVLPAEKIGALVLAPPPWWNAFFPYGFSLHQLLRNLRAVWTLGAWPWVLLWASAMVLTAVRVRRVGWKRGERALLLCLAWTGVWLLFYYGQGRFADHIGGAFMHLGNSFLRYLAPFWMMASWWACAVLLETKRTWCVLVIIMMVLLSAFGIFWALSDREDGILRGRREREHYADVQAFVLEHTSGTAIWASDRSDKILFPLRLATARMPEPEQVRAFLLTKQGEVWMYHRPFSQQERDRWTQSGIELIERARFPRERIFEAKLR